MAPAVLAGVLAFFTYYYVSQVFATAQNRSFPLYVAAASLAGFALVLSHPAERDRSLRPASTARTSGLRLISSPSRPR